jgi:hypothetical protein
MDIKLLALYFVTGGLIVATTTYFGTQGKGIWAAFIALFPGVTIVTFLTIFFHSGEGAVVSYARGMLILLPPWILYVLGIIFLLPRIGLVPTLLISIAAYVATSLLIIRLT